MASFDDEGMRTVVNACVVMTGAFPLVYILSKILKKPLIFFGKLIGISDISAMGLISCLATNVTTISMVEQMDKKGIVLNMAFAVSGAFVFAGHLAFTVSFNADYLVPVIIGKLTAGICAVILANFVYNQMHKKDQAETAEEAVKAEA
jgi:ethanolamine transporter